ncbi:MAG: cation diffusion facilitator family transporter [Rhodospirillales bacterium]|nr:cation diffusion facilitator family transporter [Rhodospirillales bacterium]
MTPGDATPPGSAISSEQAGRLMRRATYASVTVAAVLIAAKAAAWLLTGSVSVLSSLLDSLLDLAASLVNLIAIRTALTPPDREHRFGHGKAEPLAGLGQSAFIAGSAALLAVEAIQRIFNPTPIENSDIGIAVMVLSIVVTLVLLRYQRSVIARTRSLAISADELHYRSDLILNFSVIVSLILSGVFGWHLLDPAFGAAIALWIVYSAWQIAKGSLTQLMDHEIPEADRQRIREIAMAHGEVQAVHDLRTREAGQTSFVQIHLEMAPEMTLLRAHAVSDEVEASIRAAYPQAEVIIHQDPAGVSEMHRVYPPAQASA